MLARLNAFEPRKPVIDGLEYHEGLNAVWISGGVAGNVLPDECVVSVNHRFAPDRSVEEAEAFLREFFDGFEVTVMDSAPGAVPGLGLPAAQEFLDAVGGEVKPSSAGPTCPASAPSAYQPSTSAPVTRCWPTSRRSTCRSSTSSAASASCGPGSGPTLTETGTSGTGGVARASSS